MKKSILIPATVLLAGVAIFFIFFRGSSKEYEFRFDKVTQGDVTMYVTATGTINPVVKVDVGTQVSGIIAKLFADFNSVVKEGQVIAQIDPTFLQQAVKDASASLERAKAQFADSKRTLDRTKSLYEKNLESQANYDAALTAFESNQAALKQAEASLDRAKINLAYATIYAPISGVVIDREVNVGQTVAASFSSPTLYTIANDLRKMQVEATIDESDIGRISVGQEATFTVDAYPDERFRGTVSQIRLAPVSIQNVVNYTVVIAVDNAQLKLMPGMTANIKVLVGSSSGVLRVPNLALRFQPPADLVDSAKVKELRDAGFSMGGGRGEGWQRGGSGSSSEGGSGQGMADRRGMFRAVRDSIQKAHGGKLGDEDLRAEMRKFFEKMQQPSQPVTQVQQKPSTRPAQGETRYGIQNNFPEYQKSAYVPSHNTGRARVWIMGSDGKLVPVFMTTGLTDGRYTEISNSSLKEGDQVVLGVSSNSDSPTTGPNPLTPGGGGRQMGGGFR